MKTELDLLKKEINEDIEETKRIHLNNERINKLKTIKKCNKKTKTKKNLENQNYIQITVYIYLNVFTL